MKMEMIAGVLHAVGSVLFMLFYVLAWWFYAKAFTQRSPRYGQLARRFLECAVLAHLCVFIGASIYRGGFPILSIGRALEFVAWALACGYLFVEYRIKHTGLGVFILLVVGAFLTGAIMMGHHANTVVPQPSIASGGLFCFHVAMGLFSYSSFGFACGAGLTYLLLNSELRQHRLGYWAERLPPLMALDQVNHNASALGLVMLGLSIVTGITWAGLHGIPWMRDSKILSAVLLWLLYAVALSARRWYGCQGHRAAWFAVVNFLMIFVIYFLFVLSGWFQTFHRFA